MYAIYNKIPRPVNDELVSVEMPLGAVILSVGAQKVDQPYHVSAYEIFLWAQINLDQKETRRQRFRVQGTGWQTQEFLNALRFIGTVQMGSLVYHIFKEGFPEVP